MPSEAKRENIFSAVALSLAGIDGSASYHYQVETVSRDVIDPHQLPRPCIVMVEQSEPMVKPSTTKREQREAKALIVGYIDPEPGGAPTVATQLNRLYRDMRLALQSSSTFTHTSTVHRTVIEDIDPLHVVGERLAGVAFAASFLYTSEWDNP